MPECLPPSASSRAAYYDSLLAKLMVHSPEGRPTAIAKLRQALEETQVRRWVAGRVVGCSWGWLLAATDATW